MAQFRLKPVVNKSGIVSQVVEQFKEGLITGDLKPGDQLPPEPALCGQLGVSRTSVREAIKTLEAVGLVDVRRGNGTFIATSSQDGPMELLSLSFMLAPTSKETLVEARRTIERACGQLVIDNATAEDLDALSEQTNEFGRLIEAKAPARELRAHDLQFHVMLFEATHNPMFSRLGRVVMTAFAATMQRALERKGVYRAALADHRELIDAIARRSPADYLLIVDRSLATWSGETLPPSF